MSTQDLESIGLVLQEIRSEQRAMAATVNAVENNQRAMGVVLEKMQSDQRAIVEGLQNVREGLQRDIAELEARLTERIDVLESVVRQNSADIQKNSADIQKNSADIRALTEAVARLRYDFDHREERHRLDSLETRVIELEKRAGIRPPR